MVSEWKETLDRPSRYTQLGYVKGRLRILLHNDLEISIFNLSTRLPGGLWQCSNWKEFMIDNRSYTRYTVEPVVKLKSEKIQAWTLFEPITSAMSRQRSYQLNYLAIWELVTLWARNIPVEGEVCEWICLHSPDCASFMCKTCSQGAM